MPGTFSSISLKPEDYQSLDFQSFITLIYGKLGEISSERAEYYAGLREQSSRWVNGTRKFLSLAGAIAFLLTALATGVRFAPDFLSGTFKDYDKGLLFVVLAIYGVMGSLAFYERGTDKTNAYFRHITVILGIRDLWSKLQFEILKELTAFKDSGGAPINEAAAREHIVALAAGFDSDLNKLATDELTDWRTTFLASLSELNTAAMNGSQSVNTRLEQLVSSAQAAADKAAAAANSLADANKPSYVNITLSGEFDDEIVISVNDAEAARSHGKTIALGPLRPGMLRIAAKGSKNGKPLETSIMIDGKPGLQPLSLTL